MSQRKSIGILKSSIILMTSLVVNDLVNSTIHLAHIPGCSYVHRIIKQDKNNEDTNTNTKINNISNKNKKGKFNNLTSPHKNLRCTPRAFPYCKLTTTSPPQ